MALNTHIWPCNEVTSKSSPSSPISHQPTCSGPARFSHHNTSAAYGHIVDLCFILQAVYEHNVYLKLCKKKETGALKIMLLLFHVHNLKRPCLSYYNNRSEWRRDHQMCYALFRGGRATVAVSHSSGESEPQWPLFLPLSSQKPWKQQLPRWNAWVCSSSRGDPLLGHVVYCPWNSFFVISTDTER